MTSEEESCRSVNYHIPKHLCSVKYNDLDDAVRATLLAKEKMSSMPDMEPSDPIFFSKADGLSAFHQVPLSRWNWQLLILMARDPRDDKWKFFIDKCLPFRASISCTIYQRILDAVTHLVKHKQAVVFGVINYLDDFLFVEITKARCNKLMRDFLDICEQISLPVSTEKTEWSSPTMVLLGNLLDGVNLIIAIPLDKQQKAIKLLDDFAGKKKATVKQLQVLMGYLNFLSWAIFAS